MLHIALPLNIMYCCVNTAQVRVTDEGKNSKKAKYRLVPALICSSENHVCVTTRRHLIPLDFWRVALFALVDSLSDYSRVNRHS